ncbi:MAG: MFS transporter [Anaerolineae bacterium]|nr:MFS transporter [Anaerolineae bacterium]
MRPAEPPEAPTAQQGTHRGSIAILFIGLVVVMLGFGMIIPIMPFYVESLGASGRELGLLMATFAVTQLVFSPLWGDLSDRIGRRPVLILGLVGNAVAQLLFGLSTQLWMLFAARALSGILSSATQPTALAYISDSTSEEDRGRGMGLMGAAMGVGMVLGPGLGGWLASYSLPLPFFVASGLSTLVFLLAVAILPESLPEERRSGRTGRLRSLDLRLMWESLRGPLGYPYFLSFLISFALANFEGVFGLYALERYGYGPDQVGMVLTGVGLTSAVVQGLLTGPATRRWGDVRVIQGSLLASAVGFLLMLAATNLLSVLATTCLFVMGNAMLRPGVAALISKRAGERQGAAMGMSNSFMSLGRVVGPVWAGSALDWNLFLPYASGALLMAVGFATTFPGLRGPERAEKAHVWQEQ